LNKSHFRS